MRLKFSKLAFGLATLSSASLFSASVPVPTSTGTSSLTADHPFYLGLGSGVGSTTWYGLVPTGKNQNSAIQLSTPIRVNEGGTIYGFFAGYEISPHFAIEATYWQYPDAEVIFSEDSLFAYDHDDRTQFRSSTYNIGLIAKLLIDIPNTPAHLFSGAGIARIYRSDEITNQSRLSGTFVLGLSYDFTAHWTGQLGINYTAGYGESALNPANGYIPFLYSGYLGLAYRF